MCKTVGESKARPDEGCTGLLVDLFKASAELRFHIKSLRIASIKHNPSWDRHTEAMRKAESFITTNRRA